MINQLHMEPEQVVASIIVPCKGRLAHLQDTLPRMLGQECPFSYEVIVVDYGCPQGTHDWCMRLNRFPLVALKVLDKAEEFHRSRSRNCGAAISRGRILAFVDADIRLSPAWLASVVKPILAGRSDWLTVSSLKNGWDCGGTFAVTRKLFFQIAGYDELLVGWGEEDVDVYHRCGRYGAHGYYSSDLLSAIRHGHECRVQHHREKSIFKSRQRNLGRLRSRGGIVNPEGFGKGEFRIHVGECRAAVEMFPQPRRLRPSLRNGGQPLST